MATQAQQNAQAQAQMNSDFMRYSYLQAVKSDAQNGNQYSIGGNTLNYDIPIISAAWLQKLTIRIALTMTYTPNATSPYINLTAAGIYALFQNIRVSFGNDQVNVHPYIAKVLAQLTGYNRTASNTTLGNSNTDIQAMLATSPTVNSGANTWNIDIDLPLNLLHPMSVQGLLPIGGTGTRVQVFLQPTASAVGKDPLLNVVDTNGTVSFSGTADVYAWYRDFHSVATLQPLQPNIAGLSTVQVIKPSAINPLTAGSSVFKRITNPYPFIRLISLVIDGQQSGKFVSNASNITNYEIDQAENTSSVFYKYDVTNGGLANYYKQTREKYGQDFDSGVLIFDSTGTNTANASNQDGSSYLNLTSNGYPAARLGFQVGMVGNLCTPRVETWGVILNPMGIQAA